MAQKKMFGVFAPILGEKKDFPVILLNKTIQVDNSNIYRQYGEVHRRLMRKMDMLSGSTVDVNSAAGQRVLSVAATTAFTVLDRIVINDNGTREEYGIIASINAGVSITLDDNLTYTHTAAQADEVCTKTQTPDGNPILHYHTFIKRSTAMQYFLAFTKAHIYYWNTETDAWDLKFTCGSIVDADSAADQPILNVAQTTSFNVGDTVFIDRGGDREEEGVITSIQAGISITLVDNLTFTHTSVQGDEVSADCTEWDTVTYNDLVIATNNKDKVLKWDCTGLFVALDDTTNGIEYDTTTYLTRAKYVTTFENYLELGWTTEDGVVYPQRIRWNCIADETDWKSAGSGAKETEGSGRIVGFKIYNGSLIIFKEKTRIVQMLVPTSAIWNWTVLPGNIGCLSNHSIVEDAVGRVYWLANDLSIREIDTGEISQDIDPIVKLIEPSSAHLVYGIFIEETGEIWWSIPYGNALNNKIITCKDLGNWGELDLAVSCFGSYKET